MMACVMAAVFGVGRHVANEGAVDLERVDGEALEVGQARVTGAEIVHRDTHPIALEAAQHARGSSARA